MVQDLGFSKEWASIIVNIAVNILQKRRWQVFKLKAWYRENGCPVRYIIEADNVSQLWEQFVIDVDLLDVIEVNIYKEI